MADNVKNILIIGDVNCDYAHISKILSIASENFTFTYAVSFNQFLKQLEATRPVLLIVDFPSATLNNLNEFKQIKEQAFNIPIIVISGSDTSSVAVACLKSGAHDYILKTELDSLPGSVDELLNRNKYPHFIYSRAEQFHEERTANCKESGYGDIAVTIKEQNKIKKDLLHINSQLEEKVKKRTQEIEQLSDLNKAIIQNVGIAVITVSEHGLIESFNPAAEQLLGFYAEDVIGQPSSIITLEMDFLRMLPSGYGFLKTELEMPDLNTAINKGIGQMRPSFEWTLKKNDGCDVQVLLSISLLRDGEKETKGYVAVAIDITDRKTAEEAMKVSERQFHNMFEVHDAMMFLVDPETGMVIDANSSARKYYGYNFASGINIGEINTMPAEELEKEMVEAALNKRNFFVFNHRLANGDIRSVDLHSTPIMVKNKVLLFSIIRDVTDKKQAEESLKSISLRLSTLLENMQSGILFEDETRHVTLANQVFCNIFGINAPPAALFGADCEMAAQESAQLMKDPDGFLLQVHKILHEKIIVLNDEIEFADGSVYERDYIPIMQKDQLLGHLWQYRDITIRKKSQEALLWNESLLRMMANSSPLAFLVVDNRSDNIIYFNHRFCEIWGIAHLEERMQRGELKNNDIIPDCLPVLFDIPAFAESCKPLQSENNRITIEDIIPFNNARSIRRFSTQIRGDQDEYYGRLYIFEDITERKQDEYYLAMQRDLGVGLSAVSTMQETLELAIDTLLKTSNFTCGGIYLLCPKSGNLELSISRALPEDFVKSASLYKPDTIESKMVLKGESVFGIYNEIIESSDKAYLNEYFKYLSVLPILNEGKVLGSINLGSSNSNEFSIKIKHTLEAIASQIGIAIARIQAEDALRTSQQNFHLMFETLDDFMFILNMEGNIIKTNPVVQKRLGYSAQELRGMHVLDVHPVERRVEAGTIVNEMLAGSASFCPVPLITKEGKLIPVETRVILGKWDNEDALYGISRDITERKKAESELQLRESFLSAVIDNHPGLFWLKDTMGKYILVNDKNHQNFKYSNTTDNLNIIGKTDFDLLPREISEKYQAEDQSIIDTRKPIVTEEYFESEKKEIWYENFKFPVVDKKGNVIGISGYSIDITERKKSEVQLRMQNAAFESFSLAMMITDIEGGIQWVNPAFTSLTGYKIEDVIGQNPSILHSGKQDSSFHSTMRQTIEAGKIWRGELENKRKDGSLYFEEQTITPVFNEKGEIRDFIAIKIDISHRKEIEDALRVSEHRWKFAVEGSGDGIWDWNAETNEVFYSKQWKEMLGYEADELTNSLSEWSDRIHPEDRDSCLEDLQKHFDGENEIYVSEHRMMCKNGTYKWILDRGKTIDWIKPGTPRRVIGTHTDVTQQKTLEETLKQGIEKERELNDMKSRFVSTASHEFRTPLASILIISDSLIAYWQKMEEGQIVSRLERIKEQILHLAKIVNDVLKLSKIQEGKTEIHLEKIDLVQMINGIIESFDVDNQLQNKIRFESAEQSIKLMLDVRLTQQVLNNLISNAIKYAPVDPEIIIRIENNPSGLIIGVHDNGIGIPVEEQKHMFTPFYRASNTKTIPGNGLGLNIVRESVRLQGGEVTFESNPGKGSSFYIHIPNNNRVTKNQFL